MATESVRAQAEQIKNSQLRDGTWFNNRRLVVIGLGGLAAGALAIASHTGETRPPEEIMFDQLFELDGNRLSVRTTNHLQTNQSMGISCFKTDEDGNTYPFLTTTSPINVAVLDQNDCEFIAPVVLIQKPNDKPEVRTGEMLKIPDSVKVMARKANLEIQEHNK